VEKQPRKFLVGVVSPLKKGARKSSVLEDVKVIYVKENILIIN